MYQLLNKHEWSIGDPFLLNKKDLHGFIPIQYQIEVYKAKLKNELTQSYIYIYIYIYIYHI